MFTQASAKTLLDNLQDYPPGSHLVHPGAGSDSLPKNPYISLPREVGLSNIYAHGRVVRLAEAPNRGTRFGEALSVATLGGLLGSLKGNKEGSSPALIFFALKLTWTDEHGERRSFLTKTCSYQQFFRQPPFSPIRDSSPAMLVHIGAPIAGLLRSIPNGLAVFHDWRLTNNQEWMLEQPNSFWDLSQLPLEWGFWTHVPDLGGEAFSHDGFPLEERRRFLIPPPLTVKPAVDQPPRRKGQAWPDTSKRSKPVFRGPPSFLPKNTSPQPQGSSLQNTLHSYDMAPIDESYSVPSLWSRAFSEEGHSQAWPREASWDDTTDSAWQSMSSNASDAGFNSI